MKTIMERYLPVFAAEDGGSAAAAGAAGSAENGAAGAEAAAGAGAGGDQAAGAAGAAGKEAGADAAAANGAAGDGKDRTLAGDGSAGEGKAVEQKWPDDWRQTLAGKDKKSLEKLGRFATPTDLLKAYNEAQVKISQGLKPKDRPDVKATPEEWDAYRKEAGIPATVDDFVKSIELPDGRKIGDNDKPMIAAFSERAHKMGIPPKDMAELVDEYYAIQEETEVARLEKDAEFKASASQQLREEWGGDFKANVNAMRPYFETVDAELFDNLMGGRLADGTKVGDHPSVVKFFVAKALTENPAATVVPAGSNQMETINSEIAGFEKRMREDRDGWFKDAPAQARYQKLLEAQERIGSK